jgi:hypothetical protein
VCWVKYDGGCFREGSEGLTSSRQDGIGRGLRELARTKEHGQKSRLGSD